MNKEIMKAPSTNIFAKVGKAIKKGISAFFDSAWSVVVIGAIVICGIVAGIDYADKRDYPEGDYELVYNVYYTPNNVKQYTIRHNRPIQVGSQDGTNYVRKYDGGIVIQTSATIETVRYVNHKKQNE
jgi:hypothetical protein